MRTRAATTAAGVVLLTLASGQFLMTLDTSVMNVSIATVAADLGTDVTGIQLAITCYTLVMAAFMITGGKVGSILGRRRAFAIGCVVYGAGSLTTALAPNLTVLLLGWSLLEGLGAVLILPAIVALVAGNFEPGARPRAYGMIAAAGAVAVAVGPLLGGAVSEALSWRWVFAGEVVLVAAILVLVRRVHDDPAEGGRIDGIGTVLSASGLGLVVYGVLRSGTWGWVAPKSDTQLLGLSPVLWLILGGGTLLWLFAAGQRRRMDAGREPLLDPGLLRVPTLRSGVTILFFQFLVQAGLFFTVPLFLSVALGLSTLETGVRLVPLSLALLLAATTIPRLWPHASPRRVVRLGLLVDLAGIVALIAALETGVGPEVVTVPMLLIGLGIGAMSSQLGSVTVSSVPSQRAGEVGGVQNTVTNLGASIGTALAGSVLIASLTAAFLSGIANNPDVPESVVSEAEVQLASGAPFLSDAALSDALTEAGVTGPAADAIVDANETARVDALRAALGVLALLALLAVFFGRALPVAPAAPAEPAGPPDGDGG